MSGTHSNKLLPALVGLVASILFIVLMRSCSSDVSAVRTDQPYMGHIPTPPPPDRDTAAEELNALTAKLGQVEQELIQTQDNAKALMQQETQMMKRIEQRFNQEKEAIHHSMQKNAETAQKNVLNKLTEKMHKLDNQINQLRSNQQAQLDAMKSEQTLLSQGVNTTQGQQGGQWAGSGQWIEPLEQVNTKRPSRVLGQAAAQDQQKASTLSGPFLGITDKLGGLAPVRSADNKSIKEKKSPIKPVYTLNKDATLLDVTAMTALVGRVPIGESVKDPYKFKLLVGRDNLAANGIRIPPTIATTIVSGYLTGDWSLSCIRGRVTSISFVFEDGTISNRSAEGDGQGSALGYLSDPFGDCIRGVRVSNAPAYLLSRMGTTGIKAAGNAYAASQVTQLSSSGALGTVRSSEVTGNLDKYVAGKVIADSTTDLTDWLKAHQAQSFDAIYLPPGSKVAVHIEQQIEIDYDPYGRKVFYAENNEVTSELD